MKKSLLKYMLLFGFGGIAVITPSCKKDFGETNTNPSTVINPDIKFLLTYSEDRLASYMGGEYVWETMEQFWRFTQHITSDPYEITGNVNARYNAFYSSILPNLFEIRRQIDLKADKELYQKEAAITYIMQVLQGIKVTDMNGSIPYTEAEKGRYEGLYNPVYDTQETLFNTWLTELDNAMATLSAAAVAGEQNFGTADVFYQSDWTKWIKLANTLKLRIAARWENQNAAKTKEIFQQVMASATGLIDADDAQLSYVNKDYNGTGGDINYRAIRYASQSIIKFLKASNDPRIGIYFSPNDIDAGFEDTVAKYGTTLPSFIDLNDPLIEYQGGPADWTTDPTRASYFSNALPVGPTSKYFLISTINRWFMAPKWNRTDNDALYTELLVSNAESCLMVAEMIQKGYGSGVDTKGTAEDWYKKGVTSSIKTMNSIAETAHSTTAFSDDGSTLVNAYLNNDNVKLNGTNDLERIYIQEYLNFFRNMNEAFVLCRRTGYPKYGSDYYAREPFNEVIPRRWWTNDPGEVNNANWSSALSEQGFTPLSQDVNVLHNERVWYDKPAPEFGEGE